MSTDKKQLMTIEELKKQMQAATAEVSLGASDITFISFKSGVMNFDGVPIPNNKLNIVLVDAWATKNYYEGVYDSSNPQPPLCVAFGRGSNLPPHEDSPQVQSKACATCPKNKWGSGRGRGKACKDGIVIVFGLADAVKQGTDQLYAARLPVTSIKSFTTYTNMLAAAGSMMTAVVTQMACKPHPKNQFQIEFELVDALPAETATYQAVIDMMHKSSELIPEVLAPYKEDAEPEDASNIDKTKF